jgi:hypothetical protein
VRKTMAKRFPGLGLERQRKVFVTSFFQALLLQEGPALAELAGDFPALSGLGIVDGPALAAFVRQALMQRGRRLQQIWHPINMEIWVRGFSTHNNTRGTAT